MGSRRIGSFFELTPYPLPGSVEMLLQQVQIDQLIDQPQVIRRELGSFFKCLARFVISFGLAEGQAERYLELWILRRELGLFAKDYHGIVEPIKRAVSGGQEQCGVLKIGHLLQQIGHRLDHLITMAGAQIDLGKQQDRICRNSDC